VTRNDRSDPRVGAPPNPDPDRTTRDPAVQRVIDQFLSSWPTGPDTEQPDPNGQ
jgi:hypothetical protein